MSKIDTQGILASFLKGFGNFNPANLSVNISKDYGRLPDNDGLDALHISYVEDISDDESLTRADFIWLAHNYNLASSDYKISWTFAIPTLGPLSKDQDHVGIQFTEDNKARLVVLLNFYLREELTEGSYFEIEKLGAHFREKSDALLALFHQLVATLKNQKTA